MGSAVPDRTQAAVIGGKTKSTVQPKRAEQRKPTQSKLDATKGRQRSLQCYRCQGYGHRQTECLTKVSPSKGVNLIM